MRQYKFNKPLVESTLPPQDTRVLWVDVDEQTGKLLVISEFTEREDLTGWWPMMIADGTYVVAVHNFSPTLLSIHCSKGFAEAGDIITVTAEPAEGYEANIEVEWTGGDVELTEAGENTWTFEMPDGKVDVKGSAKESPFIDLGLPSGTLWAKCNLGADSPEEYGDFYAWGETESKSDYSWDTYVFGGSSSGGQTKYNTTDEKLELDAEDDAVAVAMHDNNCRIPSNEQIQELLDGTTNQWTQINDVNGLLLTSKANGKTLFIPAAGGYAGENHVQDNSSAFIWSRTLYSASSISSADMLYSASYSTYASSNYRCNGYTIRPIKIVG